MSELSDAIEEVRSELAGAAGEFMPDTCSIVKHTFTDGGASGDTLTSSTGATGVPYKYKSSGHQTQVVVGGKSYSLSHWLTFPSTEDTLAITPKDRIQDETNTELIFQEPVIIPGSFNVFVKIAATQVQQGYR